MANFFDQYDAADSAPAASPQSGGGNFFDQFTPTPPPSKEDLASSAINDSNTGRRLAAREVGYGANVVSQIPGLKELGSGIAALAGAGKGDTFGERYNDLEASQKAMREAEWKQEQSPEDLSVPLPLTDARIGPSVVGDVAGTALGAGLTGATAGKVASGVAPGISSKVASWAAKSPYLSSAAEGLGQGAVQGFARGDDEASRLADAAIMGGTGLVAGPALTLAGRKVVGPLADKAASYVRDLRGIEQPEEIPQLTKAQENARDIVQRALKTENINPNEVADRLEAAQQTKLPVTALDVATKQKGDLVTSGRNLINLTKAAATYPGEAAQLSGDVVARGAQAADRIGQHFDEAVSNNPFYQTMEDATAQGKLASPYYKQFYQANPSMQSPLIDRLLARPAGKQALAQVREDMLNEAIRMGKPDAELTEQAIDAGMQAPGGVAAGLKGETLDRVKQALDQMAYDAKQSWIKTGNSAARRDYVGTSQMAKDLRDEIDRLDTSGAYAQGRALSAQKFQMQDAAEQGRNFTKMDPEEIEKFFKDPDTSEPTKAAFLSGQRRAMQDLADNKQVGQNPIAIFNTPKMQKRLQASLGENAQPLLDKLNMEAAMHRTNQVHIGGSDTATKLGFRDAIGSQPQGLIGRAVNLATNPQGALIHEGINFADKALQKRAMQMDQETAAEVMRYMTATDPTIWRELGSESDPLKMTVTRPATVGGRPNQAPEHARGGVVNMAKGGRVISRPKKYPALEARKSA